MKKIDENLVKAVLNIISEVRNSSYTYGEISTVVVALNSLEDINEDKNEEILENINK